VRGLLIHSSPLSSTFNHLLCQGSIKINAYFGLKYTGLIFAFSNMLATGWINRQSSEGDFVYRERHQAVTCDRRRKALKAFGVIDYIQKGGLLMWPILACSIIAIGVFAERLFYLHRATIHVGEFLKGLSNLVQRRNFAEALHESAGTPGPVARVIHAAIIRHDMPRSELREIVQEAGQLEVPKLERFLGVLATIAFLAPLLGLLGTVAGMIDAFGTISSHGGYATVTELSAGVYKSLLTTAAGLVVATPTFVAYSYLSSRVNTMLHDMERAGIEIVHMLTDSEPLSGIISFQQPAGKSAGDVSRD
jgi:biopolymer transport protein ExbB